MTEQATMKTFNQFGRGRNTNDGSTVVTDAEMEVFEQAYNAGQFSSKFSAVEFLVRRGWSQKSIRSTIRYEDGREMSPQHYNQYAKKAREKIAAEKAATAQQ